MKVTSVELHPEGSLAVAILSFRDPSRQNPYNVRSIDGLGADEIVRRFYQGSGSAGTRFYNLASENKNLVISIDLNPQWSDDQTPSDLRDALYKMIASSRTGIIDVQFKNGDTVVASISGFISKFEPALFNKTSGVKITIDCAGKMLQAPVRTEVDVEDLTFDDLVSTAPHGFTMQLGFLDAVASFVMDDPGDPLWSFVATPVGGFLEDDILAFSSELGNKYLYILRGVTPIHLADVITPGSVWPIQFPGENSFEIQSIVDMEYLEVSYYPTYWGV